MGFQIFITIAIIIAIYSSAKIIQARILFEIQRSEKIIEKKIDLVVKNNMIDIRHELVSHSVRFDKLPEEIKKMIIQQLVVPVRKSF
ncbi:hypothetical protein [Clostridium algidicarnis]|uniref:hypothetical protein n=1 Tax=Clostridium algidicarnis TaxID=37659 RepID=UPI001C0B2A39|nr:hypothetical protein [Clostridium algidicarnis]MBU3226784.1 hypothetical protein [Clostridium algidicarnis]MBU3250305.1 hypothetical protein [Clostridium algidicarnis]